MITKKIDQDYDELSLGNNEFEKVGYKIGEIGFDLDALMMYEIEKDEDDNEVLFVTFRNGIEKQIYPTEKEFSIIQERFSRDTRLKK